MSTSNARPRPELAPAAAPAARRRTYAAMAQAKISEVSPMITNAGPELLTLSVRPAAAPSDSAATHSGCLSLAARSSVATNAIALEPYAVSTYAVADWWTLI